MKEPCNKTKTQHQLPPNEEVTDNELKTTETTALERTVAVATGGLISSIDYVVNTQK